MSNTFTKDFQEEVPAHVKTPPPPGEESAGPALSSLVRDFKRTTELLHAMYLRLSRQESNYRETAAGATTTTTFQADLPKVALGLEADIERITVSVGGASSGATIAVYRNGVQEGFLLDFTNGLLGSSPSRQVAEYNPPIRLAQGENLTIVIASIAAAPQPVYIRAEGRKRER